MTKEVKYDQFSKSAKKGADKISRLSSDAMAKYAQKYQRKTGKSAYNVKNKEHFYSWVSRNKIR